MVWQNILCGAAFCQACEENAVDLVDAYSILPIVGIDSIAGGRQRYAACAEEADIADGS